MLTPFPAKSLRPILVLLLTACFSCVFLAAQSTTEGAVGGTVYDATGAVVANAKIVVHNNGTNAEQTADSDASGYYRVNALQPGTYTVTIAAQGLATFKAPTVVISVGSLTELSPHLGVAGKDVTVDVTGVAPQINYVSPDFAPTIDQTSISNLPINGGRWSNFSLLTPGVVSDSNAFGLLSFRGISTLLNNNTVDGADNNQAFFSEERGRTRIGYSTPKEAVDEFQVNTSNYSSEYGRSAGGVVNTVTKSGTNKIHGSGYFYDRDNDIGAFNEFTQINVQSSPGVFTSQAFKPTDWRKIAGFGVGGPLVKDKLFWFVAYDWYKHNFPGVAVTSNPNVFFAAPTCIGTQPFNGSLCQASSQVGQLAGRILPGGNTVGNDSLIATPGTGIWFQDLNGLNSMLGLVAREGNQNILMPKLDWMINSKNHASFTFNRMRWNSPAGIQTQPTVTRGIASFGNDFVKDTWGVAKLETSISSNFINEVRFQYGRDFEFEFAQPPTPYETSTFLPGNPLGLPPSVSITNGFTFGVPTFLQRPAFPDESRYQIADTMTVTHGKHTIKYGVDFSHIDDLSQNLSTQYGSYSYSNLVNYFSDFNKPNSCGGPCYTSFSQAFGPLGFEFRTNDYAVFAQDDWKILPRLSLSLGLRWEYEQLPNPILPNSLAPQTNFKPNDRNNFGPRAGFAFDMFGNGKTVLRGGYGIYYGRVINSTIFSALTSTGVTGSQVSFFFTPTSTGAPTFPGVLTAAPPPTGAKPNIVFFDSHFQNPQIHQIDLTLERDMGWGTVLSFSYLGSLGRELPDFVDVNVCTAANQAGFGAAPGCPGPIPVTYTVVNGGPLGSGPYTTQEFQAFANNGVKVTQARPNNNFGSMTDIFSGITSSYHALVVQVNHRMSHNIQFQANYTYSHAIDYGQNQTTFTGTNFLLFPNNIAAEKGNSIYDVPNRFVASAIVNSPWKKEGALGWFTNGWQLSPIVQVQNGLPYTLSVSGNAPTGSGFFPAVSGINGSGGTNRIDILGNNSFRMPLTLEPDIRLSKSFGFREGVKLDLSADFFNIINKQNVMSVNNNGYSISASAVNTPSGPVACSAAAPCLAFNVNQTTFAPVFGSITGTNNSNFLYTPRQIQLGARVSF